MATNAAVSHLLLLAAALLAGRDWRDPLRLGVAGRLLPAALWAAVAASTWASPAPRAGRLAVVLLPAFFMLPAAVARAWRSAAPATGPTTIAALVAAVASWHLWDWIGGPVRARAPVTTLTDWSQWEKLGDSTRAMALGHHNLLAAWVVVLLPLALLPLRWPGPRRWLAAAAGMAGVTALVASRSFLGAAALGVEAALALFWWRRSRRWLVPAALLALATQVPRIVGILAGEDASAAARAVYIAGGWRGFLARPLLGWGPGAVPWTIAGWLRPAPGVNPPVEVVGDLHSLPIELLYGLGAPGALMAMATGALFLWRRRAERLEAADPRLLEAGWIGLAGAVTVSLGGAWFAVTALPVAWAVAAGAILAGCGTGPGKGAPAAAPHQAPSRVDDPIARLAAGAPLLYAVAAALLIWPLDRAHWDYDRAARLGTAAAEAADHTAESTALDDAVRRDPTFPLYRARRAWLRAAATSDGEVARDAWVAAASAGGLGPLWLAAGAAGEAAGEPWATAAFSRACALHPLSGLAPFHLAMLAPEAAAATEQGTRALLGEPKLLAAPLWAQRPDLLAAVGDRLRRLDGVDEGWRVAMVGLLPYAVATASAATASISLEMDAEPAAAFSLYAFRRRPWPAKIGRVAVRRDLADRIVVPAATTLPTTRPESLAFGCN